MDLSALPSVEEWYDDRTDELAPATGIGIWLTITMLLIGALCVLVSGMLA